MFTRGSRICKFSSNGHDEMLRKIISSPSLALSPRWRCRGSRASAAAGASPSAGSGDAGLACEEGWVENKDLVGLELRAYLNL